MVHLSDIAEIKGGLGEVEFVPAFAERTNCEDNITSKTMADCADCSIREQDYDIRQSEGL